MNWQENAETTNGKHAQASIIIEEYLPVKLQISFCPPHIAQAEFSADHGD